MSPTTLDVPVPNFIYEKQDHESLFMGPGPVNHHPDVNKALSLPMMGIFDDDLMKVMADIREGIKYVFQTKSRLTFAFSGAAMAAMECVITNLVEPGEILLVMSRGVWDQRAADIGRRHGAIVREAIVPAGRTFGLAQIEASIRVHNPAALFITHGDSSTGTVQNLDGVGALCRRYGVLSIVDAVVSVGAVPFFMDTWQIDAVYAGGQKALSAPPGLSPVSFNERAEKKIYSREKSSVWYYDVRQLADQWNVFGDTRKYHHTISFPLMHALRSALVLIAKEGLQNSWKRHRDAAEHLYKGLEMLEVGYFVPDPHNRLANVTTITFKQNDYEVMVRYLKEKCLITTNIGVGPTAGKCMRIGCMGNNARKETVDKLLSGLKEALVNTVKSKY